MGQSPDSSSYNTDGIGVPLVQGNADIQDRTTKPQRYTSLPSSKYCDVGDTLISVRAPVGSISKSIVHACIGRGIASLGKIDNFLYQFFLLKENSWGNIAQGSTFSCITAKDIENLIIGIPTVEERNKIGSFLALIDERIQTQNKIIEDLKIFRNLIYDKLICFYKTEQISIKELINRDFVRMIKPSELKPFIGVKKYLSTSSVDDEGISSIETLITYKDRPSRASMYPINKSVWFAKMKNTIKVLKSNNEIQNSYVLSTGFYGLLCDERKINSDWLLETFRSNSFNNQKDRFSEGSSMSAIKDNQLEDILINLITNKADEDKAVKLLLSLSSSIVTNKTLLEKHKKQKEYLLENMFI